MANVPTRAWLRMLHGATTSPSPTSATPAKMARARQLRAATNVPEHNTKSAGTIATSTVHTPPSRSGIEIVSVISEPVTAINDGKTAAAVAATSPTVGPA